VQAQDCFNNGLERQWAEMETHEENGMFSQYHVPEKKYIQLSIIWGKGGDSPKPELKQKQSKQGTKWI
jgi:hypothetical protein